MSEKKKVARIRVERSKFEQMLTQMSLFTRGSPVFEPLKIRVDSDGVKVALTDHSKTVASLAVYKPVYFEEYEPTGEAYEFSVVNLLRGVKKEMKGHPYINVEFNDKQVVVTTDDKQVKLTLELSETGVEEIPKYERKVYGGHALMVAFEPVVVYDVDLAPVRDMDFKDPVQIVMGTDFMMMGRIGSTMTVEKKLDASRLKEHSDTLVGYYDPKILAKAFKAIRTRATIGATLFSEEEKGQAGPLIVGTDTEQYDLTYWIAPQVV